MSAIEVHPKHIDYLISAFVAYSTANNRYEGLSQIVLMLEKENQLSLADRYRGEIPELKHRNVNITGKLDPVHVLKAIAFYQYQSCEGRERWEESEARKWIKNLQNLTIPKLPGYNDAPWGIDR